MVSSIYVPNFSPIGPLEKNLSLDQEKNEKKHGTVVTTIVAPPKVGSQKQAIRAILMQSYWRSNIIYINSFESSINNSKNLLPLPSECYISVSDE